MKRVLVISRGIFHPTVFCRRHLQDILLETKGINFDFVSGLKNLDGIDISIYHAVVLFFHEKEISDSQLDSLMSFVKSGGGLFCIHGALASFKEYDKYLDLTGSKFSGHDRIKEFPITGLYEFSVRDELYLFEIHLSCDIKLKSNDVPVFWTKKYGNGKVACLSPGHKAATFKKIEFRNLIKSILTDELTSHGGIDE